MPAGRILVPVRPVERVVGRPREAQRRAVLALVDETVEAYRAGPRAEGGVLRSCLEVAGGGVTVTAAAAFLRRGVARRLRVRGGRVAGTRGIVARGNDATVERAVGAWEAASVCRAHGEWLSTRDDRERDQRKDRPDLHHYQDTRRGGRGSRARRAHPGEACISADALAKGPSPRRRSSSVITRRKREFHATAMRTIAGYPWGSFGLSWTCRRV